MCFGCDYGPPYGIPIPPEVQAQYPDDVQKAFEIFDDWLREATEKSGEELIERSSIPEPVREAMDLILATPIPGYEGEATGADSCYMVVAQSMLTD